MQQNWETSERVKWKRDKACGSSFHPVIAAEWQDDVVAKAVKSSAFTVSFHHVPCLGRPGRCCIHSVALRGPWLST